MASSHQPRLLCEIQSHCCRSCPIWIRCPIPPPPSTWRPHQLRCSAPLSPRRARKVKGCLGVAGGRCLNPTGRRPSWRLRGTAAIVEIGRDGGASIRQDGDHCGDWERQQQLDGEGDDPYPVPSSSSSVASPLCLRSPSGFEVIVQVNQLVSIQQTLL
ncbi:hypothetical protein EJB05_50890, partial [Eragrostis curvula]